MESLFVLSCLMVTPLTSIDDNATGDAAPFSALGVNAALCSVLESKIGITQCAPVQEKVIPLLLTRKNLIFTSETGTGKTLAYLLPLLSHILSKPLPPKSNIRLLTLAPTFELASQIKKNIALLMPEAKHALLIGSAPLKRQMETLKEKPVSVTGTPARILELIQLKKLKFAPDCALVLDEVDRLFSPELRDTVRDVVESCHSGESSAMQVVACSATINESAKKILTGWIGDTAFAQMPIQNILQDNIEHHALFSESREKLDTLRKYLAASQPKKALIFTSRLVDVEKIASFLRSKKYACAALHSKTEKTARKTAMDGFISGKYSILVTSDLASRGLDILNISHVIQLDLPQDADFFVHRAGRTGRLNAGLKKFDKNGINIVIGDEREMRRYAQLEKQLGIKVFPKELRGGAVESAG
ncbi:MAG: DEAD/DEAH box helicase [Treponemataceae bacterium]|nr:MAG: DEAD/DEAH box helicase [Treponemataceae bacterium]